MISLRIVGFACITLLAGGCSTASNLVGFGDEQQTIIVETTPSAAAISIDSEYIGRSPTSISLKDISDYKELKIEAAKADYDTATKIITKIRDDRFPNSVFLKLEPTRSAQNNQNTGSQGGQQQGGQQTTIQGPTIVFPSMGTTPQVISPPAQ